MGDEDEEEDLYTYEDEVEYVDDVEIEEDNANYQSESSSKQDKYQMHEEKMIGRTDSKKIENSEESLSNRIENTNRTNRANIKYMNTIGPKGDGRNSRSQVELDEKVNTDEESFIVPEDGYVIVEYTSVLHILNSLVEEVGSLLDVDIDMIQALLQFYRWNKEKLLDAFFSDPEKVKASSGIDLYSAIKFQNQSEAKSNKSDEQKVFTCRICYDDQCLTADSFHLGCKHLFCTSCITEYLKNQISEGSPCIIANCPEHKCNQIITKSIFYRFVDESEREKYDKYLVRNFIEQSKNMKYCPAPHCDRVAVGSGVSTVRCKCSNAFCFKCGEEAHDPASCFQVQEWNMKCSNESETANWIISNTRKCPDCNARIEKNQGCNHMTCRLCKHEFCWICMDPWLDHGQGTGGYYRCNRFDSASTEIPGGGTEAQKAKIELEKYLHYYQRYHAHNMACKFASQQRLQAEKRMVEQQEAQKMSWIDVQFLKQAVEQVIECRRVLKYTYVLGYFFKNDSSKKQLFEHHQEMLEKNTERLQEYTEMSLESMDRVQVINLTRVTEKFLSSLMASMSSEEMTEGLFFASERDMITEQINTPWSSSSRRNRTPVVSTAPVNTSERSNQIETSTSYRRSNRISLYNSQVTQSTNSGALDTSARSSGLVHGNSGR